MRFSKGIVAATITLLTSTIALAQLAMTGAGGISGGSIPPGFSSFYIDFANGFASGTTYPNVTTTRTCTNCTATAPDGNGNYAQFANNVPRVQPGTGLWAEEARTNGVRNNSMAGSANSLPTNWTQSTGAGVTWSYGATFIQNGFVWLPITFSGTGNANANDNLTFDGATTVAALYGQTWTGSIYLFSSGTVPTIQIDMAERTSGGANVQSTLSGAITTTSSPIRSPFSLTLTGTLTAFLLPRIALNIVNGTTYSGTLNIAVPQWENNSLINSTVASAAVASGGTVCLNGTDTFTVVGGTGTAATFTGTVTGGILGGSLTIVNPGSYTIFPPSPASTTGGTCTTQPTVTLTPTNNAVQGFSTTPIITSGSAGVRGVESTTVTVPPTFGGSYSIYAKCTPATPIGYPVPQVAFSVGTGANNQSEVFRDSGNGNASVFANSGGSTFWSASLAASQAQNSSGKYAGSFAVSNQAAVFNGGSIITNATGTPISGALTGWLGVAPTATNLFNGSIAAIGINPTVALTGAQLQAATTLP